MPFVAESAEVPGVQVTHLPFIVFLGPLGITRIHHFPFMYLLVDFVYRGQRTTSAIIPQKLTALAFEIGSLMKSYNSSSRLSCLVQDPQGSPSPLQAHTTTLSFGHSGRP